MLRMLEDKQRVEQNPTGHEAMQDLGDQNMMMGKMAMVAKFAKQASESSFALQMLRGLPHHLPTTGATSVSPIAWLPGTAILVFRLKDGSDGCARPWWTTANTWNDSPWNAPLGPGMSPGNTSGAWLRRGGNCAKNGAMFRPYSVVPLAFGPV